MKERPILFSAPMIRAILDGRKTQTRRTRGLSRLNDSWYRDRIDKVECRDGLWHFWELGHGSSALPVFTAKCPYGARGTVLLVKEAAWMWCERRPNGVTPTGRPKWLYVPMREAPIFYAADHPKRPQTSVVSPDTGNVWGWRLKVARFLPAWAVRIRLVSTAVRVERLQDISEEDAKAEGIEEIKSLPIVRGATRSKCWRDYGIGVGFFQPVQSFRSLWESINGPGSWGANPWVWVVAFRRIQP